MRSGVLLPAAAGALLVVGGCSGGTADASTKASPSAEGAVSAGDNTLGAAEVDRFFADMDKIYEYAKAHPDSDADLNVDSDISPDAYAAEVKANPDVAKVFSELGIDPKDYAHVSGLVVGAMLDSSTQQAGGASSQAVRYYRSHKADIDARMAKMQAKFDAG